ncbi:MAG: hypothetical protein EAZ13_01520 [Sphingobacteriia bacterium]|nr:MAG: hypothetical protein EAZ13_01520 [Sphingobacteriia bacterium]
MIVLLCLSFNSLELKAQEALKEEDFFKIYKISSPEGILLEVGGLTKLPNGDLAVATRRGDIFVIENPTGLKPHFRKFATGLHEVLGLTYTNGALFCAQRGELTKLVDTDKDGKADLFETVYAWPLSGHYHEYSFGPKLAPDGSFFVSANVAFGDEEWWRGESRVPWRGWMLRITPDGSMQPHATGFRSPCGLGMIDGELFYSDNQGDWIGSGGLVHVKQGSFVGHPAGLRWTNLVNSPLKLTENQLYQVVDQRKIRGADGNYIKPENIVKEKFSTLFEAKQKIPELQLPAVWLPHGVLGISNSEILKIPENFFGPFGGQVLVGDQGQSKIARVFLEKVNGEFQGAAWDFRSGFKSGVLRMEWANDGSLFVGETNRGWGSAGDANDGLQRLVWNKKIPFEMRTVKAMPDGFEVEFTKAVNRKTAEQLASYSVESFTYKYQPVYGSPVVNNKKHLIRGISISDDGMRVRIFVDGLRKYYIHQINLFGITDNDNSFTLIHPTAYYTLNNIPEGNKSLIKPTITPQNNKPTPVVKNTNTAATVTGSADDPSMRDKLTTIAKTASIEAVNSLLIKYTCSACHQQNKKQVGPAFTEIAKRNYSTEQIIKLIYNPKKSNWPDYATEMPPMPHIPKKDVKKIAEWIQSLKK